MKIILFVSVFLSAIFCFADDYTANSACISIAERLGFIPRTITISALKSGEVMTIFGGKGQDIGISRGFESTSHPGNYPLVHLDGGSCTSTARNNMTPTTYISTGLAQYIDSKKVTKKDLDEAISTCQNAPAFKVGVEQTLKLNQKTTDAIMKGTQ